MKIKVCILLKMLEKEGLTGVLKIQASRCGGKLGGLVSHHLNFSRQCKAQLFANIRKVADCHVFRVTVPVN